MRLRYEDNDQAFIHDLPLLVELSKNGIKKLRETLSPWSESQSPIYLFGAGVRGIMAARYFRGAVKVDGFVDNDPHLCGKALHGLHVHSVTSIAEKHPNALFIITPFSFTHKTSMASQCENLGIKSLFCDDLIPAHISQRILQNIDPEAVFATADLLADDKSREVLRDFIYRVFNLEHYFRTDLIPAKYYRSFVDIGAYTGDTFEDFKLKVGNDFDNYYMIEPSKACCEMLRASYGSDARIKIFPYAAGTQKEIRYCSSDTNVQLEIADVERREASIIKGLAGAQEVHSNSVDNAPGESRVSTTKVSADSVSGLSEAHEIHLDSLDNILGDSPVSMIKMDVDGFELLTLSGATKIITTQKPVLIVCIYHEIQDLWEIPQWIESLDLGYKCYFRHPAHPVCIAIPES